LIGTSATAFGAFSIDKRGGRTARACRGAYAIERAIEPILGATRRRIGRLSASVFRFGRDFI
jgi:hypothetical protein